MRTLVEANIQGKGQVLRKREKKGTNSCTDELRN